MKLNEVQVKSGVDSNYLLSILEKCMAITKEGTSCVNVLQEYIEDSSKYNTEEGYAVLDVLEGLVSIPIDDLEEFFKANVSGSPVFTRRLSDFLVLYTDCLEVIDNALAMYTPLTYSELERVFVTLKKALGHLCMFTIYQFELNYKFVGTEVDDVANLYMRKHGISEDEMCKICTQLAAKAVVYRPVTSTFDKYPEKEAPFFDIVGPEFYDLEYIDIQQVMDIIDGVITPEQLLEQINNAQQK